MCWRMREQVIAGLWSDTSMAEGRCFEICENVKWKQRGEGMTAGSGQRCRMRGAHTRRAVQCSSSFQHNIIRQQRGFRSVWSHTGFTAMGNKIKKPIFLQLWPKTQTFLSMREAKRQLGRNQSNDLVPGQQRHAQSISSNLLLMVFFVYVYNLYTTFHGCFYTKKLHEGPFSTRVAPLGTASAPLAVLLKLQHFGCRVSLLAYFNSVHFGYLKAPGTYLPGLV